MDLSTRSKAPAAKTAGATGRRKRLPHLNTGSATMLFDGPILEQIGLEIQGTQFDLLDRKFEPERASGSYSCCRPLRTALI